MEVGAALIGVSGAICAAKASTSSGFKGRHEATYDSLVSQNHQSVARYWGASQNSQISFNDEKEYEIQLGDSREKLDQYYDSLNAYKDLSWTSPVAKWEKRKEVRKRKRAARDSSRSLSNHVASASEGSDTSSIYAESGSPPRAALDRERVDDWMDGVIDACTAEPLLQETSDYGVKWSLEEIQMLVEGCYKYAENWTAVLHDPEYNLGRHAHHELGEKWLELCAASGEHCRNTPTGTMLPDRPVMFHPKRPSAAWRPFTILEDGALLADVKLHGTQWALITQNPVFQHASRRDDELLMRWERDFFRKTLLKLDSLGRHLYIVYHAVWKEWSREDTQTLIEAYYKCGDDWSLILREPSYKFHVHRTVSESKEKWTELCDTFSKYCRDTKVLKMLPDRPFLFNPRTSSNNNWKPFTEMEDDALYTGFKVHGAEWAIIVKDSAFEQRARHDHELLKRWERGFFRKTFLSSEGEHEYISSGDTWTKWSREDTQILIEAHYKYGHDWDAILEDPDYKFNTRRWQPELHERWAHLCAAFTHYCRDEKVLTMLPDRPFMFHPKRALSAWRPFSAPEDDALCTGLKAHGIEWVIIVQDPVFQAAARHDEELLLRLERDFFRKMFLRNNAQEMYILYESAWMDWPQEDTKMLVEAYYKHGQNWSAILSDPGYTFNDICRSQSNEKWADLCDAFRKHCTANVKGLKMLPDWPFLFHPNRESPSWRPFTPVEDDTLCIGLKAHGTEWAMIVQSNDVFQASGRRDDELLMRCARDFFRKTLLSSKDIRLYTTLSGGRRRKRYREDTQTPPC